MKIRSWESKSNQQRIKLLQDSEEKTKLQYREDYEQSLNRNIIDSEVKQNLKKAIPLKKEEQSRSCIKQDSRQNSLKWNFEQMQNLIWTLTSTNSINKVLNEEVIFRIFKDYACASNNLDSLWIQASFSLDSDIYIFKGSEFQSSFKSHSKIQPMI